MSERLAELEPLVQEYAELCAVAAELGIPVPVVDGLRPVARRTDGGAPVRSTPRRRRTAAAPAASGNAEATRDAVLAAIVADPGKLIADYAATLDLTAAVLYRPVRELTNEGKVVKRSHLLYPAD